MTAIVLIVGAAIVCGLFRFNYNPQYYDNLYDRYLIVNMLALIWLPMAVILLMFRATPESFGFAKVKSRQIWVLTVALFAGLFVLIVLAARLPAFQHYYPMFKWFRGFESAFPTASSNPFVVAPWLMLYAEASYGMYLFCWEFFFRGFLLFGLQRSLGSVAAVILQAIAFGFLHWGKPEMIPSFAGGVILGILALSARSFLPAFVLHWAASISLDIMVVLSHPKP
jgi:membrane protease YdiL (CAAX protease family)